MLTPFLRILLLTCAFAFGGLFSASAASEVYWTAESGWQVRGGVLSELRGADGRNTLETMNRAREAEERGSDRRARKLYERVIKDFPNSIWSPEAFYRVAQIRLGNRQYYKAFANYQQIISRYPNSPRFNEVIGEQYRIASALMNGARNYYWGFIPGFKSKERAIGYFEQLVANAPYSDYAPLALMNSAKGHQELDNDAFAIDALDRMINAYPQSLLAPDAYLNLAKTHADLVDGPAYDQASTREAITYFEDFMILFPSDPAVADAERGLDDMRTTFARSKILIADYYYYKRRNLKAARVVYNEAITVYPDSDIAAIARERLDEVEAKLNGEPNAKKKRKKFLGLF